MNIIYKCRENQFELILTRFCTDREGNELSRNTVDYYYFARSWFDDILYEGVCNIPLTPNNVINERPKLCVTGFEQDCYETVLKYPASQCSLRRSQSIFIQKFRLYCTTYTSKRSQSPHKLLTLWLKSCL